MENRLAKYPFRLAEIIDSGDNKTQESMSQEPEMPEEIENGKIAKLNSGGGGDTVDFSDDQRVRPYILRVQAQHCLFFSL